MTPREEGRVQNHYDGDVDTTLILRSNFAFCSMTSMEYPILFCVFCVETAHDCVFHSKALVLGEDSISTMAPKHSHRGILGLGEVSTDNHDKGCVTRSQIQVYKASNYFKYFVPLVTCIKIESVADC